MIKTAVLSDDGVYRYSLVRRWDEGARSLVFIMLNPSTADADIDDPTIRRCMGFAKREGFGGIVVVNLFAFRATKPADLWKADNPIGPENADHLRLAFTYTMGRPLIAAWGAHGQGTAGEATAKRLAYSLGHAFSCLGKTTKGAPCHPLRLASLTPLEPWA